MRQYQPGGFLSSLAQQLSGSQAPPVAPAPKKKKKNKIQLPAFELPDWMKEPPTLPDVSDAVLPTVPTPDPLAKVSVSSGEEMRLRKKRRGLLAAAGTAGNSGGWLKA